MDARILDPEGARERLAAWKDRIDKLAADTRAMSERLQAVRVTAGDPAGLAEVTVDSTGALVDLRLTDRIQRTPPAVVARTILATLGEARNRLADQSREIISETVGTGSAAAARAIADTVERRLRTGPPPERPGGSGDDDEGFDLRSYLGRR
ncbi:YbaB/EbfC family nucleoid-associated protein [Amycolatopsis rhizosphaerae]|uniref:YbaB/EbfC family nucleoid-associated protein n=1 Tax=Amycolatopsis rhizosphaerae TaxID=2053003 RepID=A0A558CX14_9PSEU|nr:YbaB/EbfC family nucleoid-associated protein [Amycolatopsis rhizosphaerae]TVT53286.1 YbaB/EbfC family nucleoid-associated protein [Amycolatopsis rhizosphaerae]